MPDVLYLSDQSHPGLGEVPDYGFTSMGAGGVPTQEQLDQVDLVFVHGQLSGVERAQQLAGVLNLAIRRGKTLIAAYPEYVDGPLQVFINAIVGGAAGAALPPLRIVDPDPAFAEYFEVFGRSGEVFEPVEGGETIGWIEHNAERFPAAVYVRRGESLIYLLPYYFGGAPGFLRAVLDAVSAHSNTVGTAIPDFLSELRLPGEDALLQEIAQAEVALDGLRERASELARFRHLVGRASGANLEVLVIEALNTILRATPYRAEDRADVRAEDFWIVGPEGDFALAEVKGQNTHVRRDDVNQVDSHRDEIGELAHDLPGLLIVNVFRGYNEMEQRTLPVAPQAYRRAAASHVLVLRTYDLFNLLHRAMAGEDVGTNFIECLQGDGGWLEVESQQWVLHTN